MGLFHRKKNKKVRFGARIVPNCEYCAHMTQTGRVCGKQDASSCKMFLYNPLMRTPKTARVLKVNEYSAEDFSID